MLLLNSGAMMSKLESSKKVSAGSVPPFLPKNMLTTYRRRIGRWIGLAVFFLVLGAALPAQIRPATVETVEPPAWQKGPSSILTLHLSGQHLDSVVRVAVRHKGVRVARIESPDANHLSVFLHVAPDAQPGTMMLQVSTRFMTTFTAVPMLEQNAILSSRGGLSDDQ